MLLKSSPLRSLVSHNAHRNAAAAAPYIRRHGARNHMPALPPTLCKRRRDSYWQKNKSSAAAMPSPMARISCLQRRASAILGGISQRKKKSVDQTNSALDPTENPGWLGMKSADLLVGEIPKAGVHPHPCRPPYLTVHGDLDVRGDWQRGRQRGLPTNHLRGTHDADVCA